MDAPLASPQSKWDDLPAIPLASIRSAGASELAERVIANVERVMVGKRDAIELLVVALLAEGHALIEDVPGVGKTTLARALARSIGGEFRRIQMTPDVLPSDIGGISFFDQKLGDFRFRPGPVFGNVVLADEINRATPRTQSALLEAMEERTVTVDGETRALPLPFFVLATENPIELEGTFPLPEAQLDRFLMKVDVGYPTPDEEDAMLRRFQTESPLATLQAVASPDEIRAATALCRRVFVAEDVRRYLTAITRGTRVHGAVALGASPRASLALLRASQVKAAIDRRDFVTPDDVKRLAGSVLTHRLTIEPEFRLRGREAAGVLAEVVAAIPVPVEGSAAGAPARQDG